MPQVPSTFVFLGIGDRDKGTDVSLHNPKFQMDESQMPLGAALHASVALQFLQQHSDSQRACGSGVADRQEL